MRSPDCSRWAVAACGSSSSSSSGSSGGATTSGSAERPAQGGREPGRPARCYGKKKGGVLTVYSSEDFEHLDPGAAYFTQRLRGRRTRPSGRCSPTRRTRARRSARIWRPRSRRRPTVGSPTAARRSPSTSSTGVHFSPPVNREVTSADVAYAHRARRQPQCRQRRTSRRTSARHRRRRWSAPRAPSYKGGPIPGIQTPSKYTIVFHMTKPRSGALIDGAQPAALGAGARRSSPGRWTRRAPTTYGTQDVVATGPVHDQVRSQDGRVRRASATRRASR